MCVGGVSCQPVTTDRVTGRGRDFPGKRPMRLQEGAGLPPEHLSLRGPAHPPGLQASAILLGAPAAEGRRRSAREPPCVGPSCRAQPRTDQSRTPLLRIKRERGCRQLQVQTAFILFYGKLPLLLQGLLRGGRKQNESQAGTRACLCCSASPQRPAQRTASTDTPPHPSRLQPTKHTQRAGCD